MCFIFNHTWVYKNYFIFFLFIFSFYVSELKCQTRLGDPLEENTIICHTSRHGYLYMGIDNYVSLNKSNVPSAENYLLQSNNGTVFPDSNDLYLIVPVRQGKVRMLVFTINVADTQLVGYHYFTVKKVPDPKLTLNQMPISTPTILPKKFLMSCDSIGIFISNDIPGSENWFRITEFTFGYNYGGYYISHKNLSNKFTSETKRIIDLTAPDREVSIRPKVESEGKVKVELPIYRITIY